MMYIDAQLPPCIISVKAPETPPPDNRLNPRNMEESISTIEYLVEMFFHNKFLESEEMMMSVPDRESHPYLVIGPCYIKWIFAMLTMERDHVDACFERIKETLSCVSSHRKNLGVTSWFFKPDYNEFTDEEAHMEIIAGEANIMSIMMTVLSDASLFTMIKAAMRLRTAYNCYHRCGQIFAEKTNWKSEILRKNFETGYKMGWGIYNVFISHLPTRVLKIASFMGFESDRDVGFDFCREVIRNDETFRAKFCSLAICMYTFYMEQFFGCGTADLDWVKQITNTQLQKFPDGAFDLFFSGRSEQVHGNAEEAIVKFNKCIKAQDQISGLHNICTWDLCWSYAILGDWGNAADCAKRLSESCNWSKTTNVYQWACFQHMIMMEEGKPELMGEISESLKQVPEFRRRIVGRTIPPEKFAITKSAAFLSNEEDMMLPVYELFYIWNIYGTAAMNPGLLDPILKNMAKEMDDLQGKSEQYYVFLLLTGVCLRNQSKSDEAVKCFEKILAHESEIKKVTYIPPHAAFELGLTLMDVRRYKESKQWLEKARDHYTGFLIESLVHLRIHGALQKLKLMTKDNLLPQRCISVP